MNEQFEKVLGRDLHQFLLMMNEVDERIPDYPGEGYYGELVYRMQYGDTVGEPFPWLFIDRDTLAAAARQAGYRMDVVAESEHYDYLARLTKL